jgi:hypothetical protein
MGLRQTKIMWHGNSLWVDGEADDVRGVEEAFGRLIDKCRYDLGEDYGCSPNKYSPGPGLGSEPSRESQAPSPASCPAPDASPGVGTVGLPPYQAQSPANKGLTSVGIEAQAAESQGSSHAPTPASAPVPSVKIDPPPDFPPTVPLQILGRYQVWFRSSLGTLHMAGDHDNLRVALDHSDLINATWPDSRVIDMGRIEEAFR